MIFPGKYYEVYTNLTKAATSTWSFEVFKKDQLPERWHIKNIPRLDGILCLLAKPGYAFSDGSYNYTLENTSS